MRNPRFLTHVAVRNYRSIASCDVVLKQLTLLVGPNNAGKSTFLDVLRFLADALRGSVFQAVRDRGGFSAVCRQTDPRPEGFGIRVAFVLEEVSVSYAVKIGQGAAGELEVLREDCLVTPLDRSRKPNFFSTRCGLVTETTCSHRVAAIPGRLYLEVVADLAEFGPAYNALSRMAFYKLNPDAIRHTAAPHLDGLLKRDGSNAASVLAKIERLNPDFKERIETYLAHAVPGLVGISRKLLGAEETVEFRQRIAGADSPRRFLASNMSDGALRALGLLLALFQCSDTEQQCLQLIGLEEPEAGFYPADAEVLVDGLLDSAERHQLIVTSHGPELLDASGIGPDSILLADAENGETRIGPPSEADLSMIRERLYTPGELLRMHQLQLSPMVVEQRLPDTDLFDFAP